MTLSTEQNRPNSPDYTNDLEKKKQSNGMLDTFSHSLGKDVGAVASNATQRATKYIDGTRHYVEGNPIKGVAFAAAAGLAVGSILTMATRSRK